MKNQNIMFTRSVPKMSKARLFRSVLALGVVALIMQVSLPRAQAYDLSSLNVSCSNIFNASWSQNLTGTYTMNANGTGTMTLTGDHRRHFVIGAGGNELKYIGTDPN